MCSKVVIAGMLLGLVAQAGGCGYRQPYMGYTRLDRGLVLVFTGIEGRSPFNEAICRGLDEGGVDWAIELVDWTVGVPGAYLVNLRAEDRNRRRADAIAERIVRYRLAHPDRPVVLVGQSGGGAMAVWTAEAMPMGQKVDGVILLAAALSPDYMLDLALFKSRRGMVNFHSRGDWFFLMLGTTFFGTMDGQHGASAGRTGFTGFNPEFAPHDKLYQVTWREHMSHTGHRGWHLTSGAGGFVARFVAPLVTSSQWDRQFLDELTTAAQPDVSDSGIPGLKLLQP